MENIVCDPPDGVHNLDLIEASDWSTNSDISSNSNNNNSTLLYIAVEYVDKNEYKIDNANTFSTHNNFVDFQDVSPLDPNMSSVARCSPVYNDENTNYNPVVIHRLVTPTNSADDNNQQFVDNLHSDASLETMSTVLCNNDTTNGSDNQYLCMVTGNEIIDNSNVGSALHNGDNLQTISKNEQEVEILITDHATGMSYSVSTQLGNQDLLVERCLEDEQNILDVLTPDHTLLDSDLLAIDENTLKNNIPEDVHNFISNFGNSQVIKTEFDLDKYDTRSRRQNEVEHEDELLSKVYSIIDRPILSRARASLPESYLIINKIDEELGVFAKKPIPKRTQFGPIAGILKNQADYVVAANKLDFLILDEDEVLGLDISNEDQSNWMCFVRKADNFQEQNLWVSQHEKSLYFTVIKNILPKQELKVGCSLSYANQHNFQILEEVIEPTWPCFECTELFPTSEDLQNHLNVHDDEKKNENVKPKKKIWKSKKKLLKKVSTEALQCNVCGQVLVPHKYSLLKHHLSAKHNLNNCAVDNYYSVVRNFKCEHCNVVFNSEALYKIHNIQHEIDDTSSEQNHHICPSCTKKFPTQKQLILHVSVHSLPKFKIIPERFHCPLCHNSYPLRERLQRHMLVHGPEESKPLQCKTCLKRFMNNSALTCHMKTHYTGKNIYECPICKETFDHVLKLKLHVPKHSINNMYTCPHCNKIFRAYSIIRKHIRAFHSERRHVCSQCSNCFPTVDKLRMHLLRHSDHREFLCADCGKQFKRKDKLKEHCKRMHSEEQENKLPKPKPPPPPPKKFTPKVEPTDFHRFIYKCHTCLVGFKRRGMLVNHLAKRHPDISPDSVPELNLPILRTTRDYYCQYCAKVYKSSSKRKAHILKNHPGAALPMSNRKQGGVYSEVAAATVAVGGGGGLANSTFSQTVGSVTTRPQNCAWCHKQYASKAKLLQHMRKKHPEHSDENKSAIDETEVIDIDERKPVVRKEFAIEDDAGRFKPDVLAATEQVLSNGLDEFVDDPEPENQYCHLVNVGEDDEYQQTNLNGGTPNSHLYRLLTTSNGVVAVPPR